MNRIVMLTDTNRRDCAGAFDICNVNESGIEAIEKYHGAIADVHGERSAEDLLRRIRRHHDPSVFLKPVYMASNGRAPGKFLVALTDGSISKHDGAAIDFDGEMDAIASKTARIPPAANGAPAPPSAIARTLQWMYTRNRNLDALATRASRFGYTYPFVEAQFAHDEHKMFETLAYLEQHALLQAHYVDRVHQCAKCLCAFLNFRETCPRCRSSQVLVHDLVHHFSCGGIGPEPDFATDKGLRCPKCKKMLRHIGVDYDRPSIVYECKKCGNPFQQALVDTVCLDCGATADPKDLVVRTVNNYSLTPLGENAILSGVHVTLANVLKSVSGALSKEAFEEILRLEIERHKRYGKTKSSLGVLRIDEFEKLYQKFGQNIQLISDEMAGLIQSVTRPTDVLTCLAPSVLALLFLDTDASGTAVIMERLTAKIESLLVANTRLDLRCSRSAVDLDGKYTARETMERMLSHG